MLDGKFESLFDSDIKKFQNNEIDADQLSNINKKYEMYLTYVNYIEENNIYVITITPLMSFVSPGNDKQIYERLNDFDCYMKNSNTLHIMDILLKNYYPNTESIKYITIGKNSFQEKVNIETKNINLNWLKNQINTNNNTNQVVETKYGNLLIVDMIAYGNTDTIKKIQQQIPKNSWILVSDQTPPMRQTTRQVWPQSGTSTSTSTSQYDPEYMRDYYHVRKLDKYKMKIKIQSEAVKLGMSYANYRKQFYPNFTFRDEKVKFSITNNNNNVVVTTVDDLLKAYISVPI